MFRAGFTKARVSISRIVQNQYYENKLKLMNEKRICDYKISLAGISDHKNIGVP